MTIHSEHTDIQTRKLANKMLREAGYQVNDPCDPVSSKAEKVTLVGELVNTFLTIVAVLTVVMTIYLLIR